MARNTTYPGLTTRTLKATQGFCSLLTPDGYNPKTKKGRAKGYSSAILHFAPAALSGFNVCKWSSAGCRGGCLNTAGHGGIIKTGETTNEVQQARIARTRWFFEQKQDFLAQLLAEIETHCRRARNNGLTPVVRLNGTSDIPWERVRTGDGRTIFEHFQDVQFYDYTKSPERVCAFVAGHLPANYHLTFSRSESNSADVATVLQAGGNVAAVFKTTKKAPMPASWHGVPVANGDEDDLRFLDTHGVIVGLKAKGKAKKDDSGFVILPGTRAAFPLPMAS